MDGFYDNLRMGIIRQAVDDYCFAVRRIVELNDTEKAIEKIIKNGQKKKPPKQYTVEEAEEERQYKLSIETARLKEVESFLRSKWYKQLCEIDSEYMVVETRRKAIDELIRIMVAKLREITDKNVNSKKSQKALEDYKTLKKFLESDWLEKFTDRCSDEILREIRRKSECKICDKIA